MAKDTSLSHGGCQSLCIERTAVLKISEKYQQFLEIEKITRKSVNRNFGAYSKLYPSRLPSDIIKLCRVMPDSGSEGWILLNHVTLMINPYNREPKATYYAHGQLLYANKDPRKGSYTTTSL